jgi:hypothetical protein
VQGKIKHGLETLVRVDDYLLRIDVNERALTHRLGMYYQVLFPKWYVDCEYNKRQDQPKDVEFDIKNFLDRMADLLRERHTRVVQDLMGRLSRQIVDAEELESLARQLRDPELEYDSELGLWIFILTLLNGDKVYKPLVPDIIVHKRGRENNYIAIEAKKTSTTDAASREYDLLKLQAYIQDNRYKYKYGFFLNLPVGSDFSENVEFTFTPDRYEPRVILVEPNTNGNDE